MPTTFALKVKRTDNGKTHWSQCGVAFPNWNEAGDLKSIGFRLDLLPETEIVAFPPETGDGRFLNACVKRETPEKTYWRPCGIAFPHRDEAGDLKSIGFRLDLLPSTEMVAFPPRAETV